MFRRAAFPFAALALASSLALGAGCKDKVEALPDTPPAADDDWIDAIDSDEEGGEIAAAEPVAAEAPAAPAEGEAAPVGETEGTVAAPAGETEGAAEGAAAAGEPAAVAAAGSGSGSPAKANAGQGSAAAAPSAAAAAGEPAAAEPAEGDAVAPAEGVAEAPAAPAPAAEPAPAPAPAEPAAPPPITMADYGGTYTFTGGSGQKQQLTAAIESAAQSVSAIIRGIARKRLTKTQILETPITITVNGDNVSFKLGTTGNTWSAKIDGPTTTMKYSGDKYKVNVRSKKGKMITTFMAPDATKTIVYVLSSDRKRLTVHHRLVADQLPEPLTFKLSYTRK